MSLMRIDDLFHFEKGTLQSSKCTEGEFDFITASSEWKTHNEYTHDCEALVFAAAASGSLGRTHYVNGKFISSDLCFIITPKDPKEFPIDLKFYHMIFNEFKDDIVKNTKAGTSKEAISLKAFGKYKLPYFNIDKQVEAKNQFVNMQESKVKLNIELTHQLDLIKQLRQAFLREAMQGKLVGSAQLKVGTETGHDLLAKIKAEKAKLIAENLPAGKAGKLKKEKELPPISEDEIPFEIPAHWAWCRLGEICSIKGGKRVPNGYKLLKEPTPYIYIRVSDMKNGTISDNDLHYIDENVYQGIKQYTIGKDDIYMTIVGGTIGKCGLVPEKFDNMNLTENAAKITPILVDKKFLWKCLDSPFCQSQFIDKTKQVGVQKMALNRFSSSLIPLPPLHEQELIVAKLEELMAFCDGLEQSIKESQGYNEKLLQQVLREALQGEEIIKN